MIRAKHLVIAAAIAGLGGVAMAAVPFGALAPMQRGVWRFTAIGGGDARTVCIVQPLRLVQFNHPGPPCPHFTIEDGIDHVTIQYNCGPRGYGRTTIKVEQPSLIRLDTQGIDADGRPFDASYEGRAVGPCLPPPPR